MLEDVYIEMSPFDRENNDGFFKAIIHKDRHCKSVVSWLFESYCDRLNDFYYVRMGISKNNFVMVRKSEPKCPDCFEVKIN